VATGAVVQVGRSAVTFINSARQAVVADATEFSIAGFQRARKGGRHYRIRTTG